MLLYTTFNIFCMLCLCSTVLGAPVQESNGTLLTVAEAHPEDGNTTHWETSKQIHASDTEDYLVNIVEEVENLAKDEVDKVKDGYLKVGGLEDHSSILAKRQAPLDPLDELVAIVVEETLAGDYLYDDDFDYFMGVPADPIVPYL